MNEGTTPQISKRFSRSLLLGMLLLFLLIAATYLYSVHEVTSLKGFVSGFLIIISFIIGVKLNINNSPSRRKINISLGFYHAIILIFILFIFPPASSLALVYLALVVLVEYYYDLLHALSSIILFAVANFVLLFLRAEVTTPGDVLVVITYVIIMSLVVLIVETTHRESKLMLSEISTNLKWSAISKKRYEGLINNIAEAVIAIDESGLIVVHNYELQNLLDTNNDLHNQKLSSALVLIDKNHQSVSLADILPKTNTPIRYNDLYLVRKDEFVPVSISIANVRDQYQSEAIFKHTIVIRDFTAEKTLEDEKSEFISVISHELRTPIAIAEGNISNALIVNEHGAKDEKIEKALNTTHDQVVFLADMINDLDTLTRADKNSLDIKLETLDVEQIINEIAAKYAPEGAKKDINIRTNIKIRRSVITSKEFLMNILEALMDNALKYTEQGTITIQVVKGDSGVAIEVEDTGIGISNKDLPYIFDKFYRSEDFHTREHGGTGLGLYIALSLSRRINGELTAKSELGKGSTFRLEIPSIGAKPEDYKQTSEIEVSELLKGL